MSVRSSIPRPFVWLAVLYGLAMVPLAVVLLGFELPLVLPYAWHKLLHVIGAAFFVGNAIIEVAWVSAAMKTRDPRIIRFALRAMVWGDVVFLGGGLFLALLNGAFLVTSWQGVFGQSWLVGGLILLALTSVPAAVVLPAQIRLWHAAESTDQDAPLPSGFDRSMRTWSIWGTATLPPILGLIWLMFLKPTLW